MIAESHRSVCRNNRPPRLAAKVSGNPSELFAFSVTLKLSACLARFLRGAMLSSCLVGETTEILPSY